VTCQEFVDFLMAYLDGELPAAQREAFDGHMDACPGCVTYLDTYRESVRLGKQVLCGTSDEPIPDDVPEDLVEAILAARKS
jgi:anti-sigma factor RsiW